MQNIAGTHIGEEELVGIIIDGLNDPVNTSAMRYVTTTLADLRVYLRKYEVMIASRPTLVTTPRTTAPAARTPSVPTLKPSSAPRTKEVKAEPRCYNCSQYGHYQSSCPQPLRPRGACFKCYQPGHTHRECPNRATTTVAAHSSVTDPADNSALYSEQEMALVNKSSPAAVSNVEVETLRQRIQDQELTIQELRSMIQRLASENSQLKSHFDTKDHEVQLRNDIQLNGAAVGDGTPGVMDAVASRQAAAAAAAAAYAKRPVSMYETRQVPRSDEGRPPITQSLYSIAPVPAGADTMNFGSAGGGSAGGDGQMPPFEEVKHRTDQVARRIKELFAAMKDLGQREAFIPCAERIRLAVVDLMGLFPGSLIANESIRSALQQQNFHANLIQAECARLQQCLAAENGQLNGGASPGGGQGGSKGLGESIQQSMEQVRACAYELAKSTKILITHLQQS
uniref:CCHC-type domain-containing protein n=1 Tax=Anopheles atroparvus TaxID=41427 RepID=A0AAG5DT79_ANOAO